MMPGNGLLGSLRIGAEGRFPDSINCQQKIELMCPQENKGQPDDGTRTLHLGKFAHGKPAPKDEPISNDDSPTLMIKKAAQAVAREEHCQIVLPPGMNMTPTEMLSALSYCYAKGVFTSDEIEQKMMSDADFRQALQNEVPRPEVLRKFRKLNHAAIIAVLEKYYTAKRRQAKARALGEAGFKLPDLGGNTTVIISKKQAFNRLNEAMFTDNLTREE
jgi:hypothetical protein